MREWTLRSAAPSDVTALVDLSEELGYPSSTAQMNERLRALLDSADHAVFVACDDEGIVRGWIHVFRIVHLESEIFAEVGGLVVAGNARGQGCGRRLLEAAERWAVLQHIGRLRVRTRTQRTGAHVFYETCGYTRTKSQHVYDKSVHDPSGE